MYIQLKRYSSSKTLIFLNIVSLLLFLFILYCVINESYIISIDRWINRNIIAIQTPTLTKIIIFITNFNGIVGNFVFAIFAIIFLTYKKWYRSRLFYLLSFSGAVILFTGIKQIIARNRPHSDLIDVINYSFPSGHSTLSMTTALLIYFIFIKRLSSNLIKNMLFSISFLWVLFIAFTRVYLNVHWLSDVVAGLILGIFWVTSMKIFLKK